MINFKKYGKRCLSLFLAASMILMPAVQTFAEEETAAATTDSTQIAGEECNYTLLYKKSSYLIVNVDAAA